ncbi:hypothetical protein EON64_20570 [archaeon]|nr:MAG: hypothetical protein EON64_20570 [archaeon]
MVRKQNSREALDRFAEDNGNVDMMMIGSSRGIMIVFGPHAAGLKECAFAEFLYTSVHVSI